MINQTIRKVGCLPCSKKLTAEDRGWFTKRTRKQVSGNNVLFELQVLLEIYAFLTMCYLVRLHKKMESCKSSHLWNILGYWLYSKFEFSPQ